MPKSSRKSDPLPWLPARARDGHKGDYGRILVIAGSLEMPGAAFLCGEAAARAGAGLVRIAVPSALAPVLGARVVVETLASLQSTAAGTLAWGARERILALAREADAVALGPGLSRHPETATLIREVAIAIDRPLVLDADGLNAFSEDAKTGGSMLARLRERRAPTILTPHPGEMGRLLGIEAAAVQADRKEAALELHRRVTERPVSAEGPPPLLTANHLAGAPSRKEPKAPATIVNLKGAGTVITDGKRAVVNKTGNPGMATGGTGDVLTGVIAAFLGRGLAPFDAALLAAHVHGRAGDLAAREHGEEGMLATDLLASLARAVGERARRRP